VPIPLFGHQRTHCSMMAPRRRTRPRSRWVLERICAPDRIASSLADGKRDPFKE
jgi:hypothetical protein